MKGKEVFVRCDLNVPLDKDLNITDDTRIRAAIPTLEYLVKNGAKVLVTSHLVRRDAMRCDRDDDDDDVLGARSAVRWTDRAVRWRAQCFCACARASPRRGRSSRAPWRGHHRDRDIGLIHFERASRGSRGARTTEDDRVTFRIAIAIARYGVTDVCVAWRVR